LTIRVYVRKKADRDDLLLYFTNPATGREVSKTSGTADRREAERAAALWQQELIGYRGEQEDGWGYFRERLREEHLTTLSRFGVSSFSTALNHYERLMSPDTLANVTTSSISSFYAKLISDGAKPASAASYVGHIRAALGWAADMGIIGSVPKIRLPKSINRVFMRGRPVTENEYRAMLDAADRPELHRLMELLWLSGMRLGEGTRLSWDKPPIVACLDARPYPTIMYYGEGHKARRDDVVPMVPELAAWLERTPKRQRHGLVAPVEFANLSHVSATISRYGRKALVYVNDDNKPGSAHDLRRAFGTRWAQRVMPAVLKVLMRHADIKTTLRYYVNITTSDAGAAVWNVPATVPPKQSNRGKSRRERVKT
jgi:integrase